MENPFQLPIQYLDPKEVYILSDTVAADLELSAIDASSNTMYHHLMNPTTQFEETLIPLWKKHYTTNVDFLEETQEVVSSVGICCQTVTNEDYESIMAVWRDTKEDPNFLERYSYMEFEMLKWVNKMPSFLQAMTVVNMASPVLSFLIPFVLFLMPFFIVKMQGYPITFNIYMSVLKDISKNHFIGKMLANMENFTIESVLYVLALLGLYIYQIYQNYMACTRFYENIRRINEQLFYLQRYLDVSISSMETFSRVIKNQSTYSPFHTSMMTQYAQLQKLRTHLYGIRMFEPSLSKIGEVGTLLECYYEVHSNKEYEAAILYSFSFHGYVKNMLGLFENLQKGVIGKASFATDISGLVIKNQYYPALVNESFVTNDANIAKNMVITGPNAAGKTTFLKTTMLNIIFSQQFGCGFYTDCSIHPYTHIHSYLNIPDTSGRDSLFQAESRRCKEIIDDVLFTDGSARHFCIFDELYSGTNPAEATKSAYAFLLWLSERKNVDFILTTHYVSICSRFIKSKARIANWKMDAVQDDSGDITYSYKIVKGVSKIQGAIKVLRDMEYPPEILKSIVEYE